jgi:chemotaxis protein methyltransferase CheR
MSLSPDDLARFRGLIRERSGLEVPETRLRNLERVVRRTVAENALADPVALYEHLAKSGANDVAMESFIAALTVGETHFFRNRPQFEALEQHILPDLIARRRGSRRLRLWSAGCATGEEPYSLAILLERLIPDLALWDVRILATDISRPALERAREGIYGRWSFRQVPQEIERDHFIAVGEKRAVRPETRSRVTFAYLNLVEDVYPSTATGTDDVDLILCRNVVIYFREDTIRAILGRMRDALADDGWMIVGHADPSPATFQPFQTFHFPHTMAYKKSAHADDGLAVPMPLPAEIRRYHTVAVAAPHVRRTPPRMARVDGIDAYNAARSLADGHRLEEAEAMADLAVQRDPFSARAHYLRAMILQDRGRRDDALRALRRCVYADPAFALGHVGLAGAFAQSGQRKRAEKALANAARALAGRAPEEPLQEGEELTVGRLLEMIALQRELVSARGTAADPSHTVTGGHGTVREAADV